MTYPGSELERRVLEIVRWWSRYSIALASFTFVCGLAIGLSVGARFL